jgi:hypothetical protein
MLKKDMRPSIQDWSKTYGTWGKNHCIRKRRFAMSEIEEKEVLLDIPKLN